MPIYLPDPIAYIFAPNVIHPEDFTLSPEDPSLPEPGQVKVRALDGFLFVKNGCFVYPKHDTPDSWWEGVVGYGYMAALTGASKYFIWAGLWDVDYDEGHLEVVILANLRGLSKERSVHWRRGQEHILWLDTAQGYSYALLEAAQEYDRGQWARVIESWTDMKHPNKRSNPAFTPLKLGDARPKWWGKDGDDAWNHWVEEPVPSPQLVKASALAQQTLTATPLSANKAQTVADSTVAELSEAKSMAQGSKSAVITNKKKGKIATCAPNPAQQLTKRVVHAIEVTSDSDDQDPKAASSKLPSSSKPNKGSATKQRTPKRKPSAKSISKVFSGPSGVPHRKRRVASGASDAPDRQRQKTVEHIVISDSSEGEDSSHSPSPQSLHTMREGGDQSSPTTAMGSITPRSDIVAAEIVGEH